MNQNQLVDRFCDSQRRWLIVTAVTIVVALVTVLPQVDQFISLRADEDAKVEQLAEAQQTAEMLPRLRSRVSATTTELDVYESRTLPSDSVAVFRNRLVDIVRDSGCQVRRLGVNSVKSRPWRENDRPLADAKEKTGPETPFRFETRPVSLSVTGTMSQLRTLLTEIESTGMMMHTRSVELKPTGRGGRNLQVDLELWCFALSRGKDKKA